MKHFFLLIGLAVPLYAQTSLKDDLKKQKPTKQEASPTEILEKHGTGSIKTANDQDELSADVQDLIQEQTDDKVIKLLEEAEKLMAEATDSLELKKTGGLTIAIETEIIERIYEAAKQKKKQSKEGEEEQQEKGEQGKPGTGKPSPSDGMMEMLEQMMGKQSGEGKTPGGEQAGKGNEGDSDSVNELQNQQPNEGNNSIRRIPKSSGTAGSSLPRELQKALDAFNKAAAENN